MDLIDVLQKNYTITQGYAIGMYQSQPSMYHHIRNVLKTAIKTNLPK